LRIDEHPPDANRGFDLPSALFTFPHLQTARSYGSVNTAANAVFDQPFFQTLLVHTLFCLLALSSALRVMLYDGVKTCSQQVTIFIHKKNLGH
jgi:hypothetical protein